MTMFTGDLKPDMEVTLSAREAVDITFATQVRIIGTRDGVIIFDRAPNTTEVVDDTSVVTMVWQDGDTDEPGVIEVEVEVTWPGPRKQTFRARGGVNVAPDFDYVTV